MLHLRVLARKSRLPACRGRWDPEIGRVFWTDIPRCLVRLSWPPGPTGSTQRGTFHKKSIWSFSGSSTRSPQRCVECSRPSVSAFSVWAVRQPILMSIGTCVASCRYSPRAAAVPRTHARGRHRRADRARAHVLCGPIGCVYCIERLTLSQHCDSEQMTKDPRIVP